MINWKVRLKNPVFIVQVVLSVITAVLAYAGLTLSDIGTWSALGKVIVDAVQNPYVVWLIAVSIWNALNDPTTKGLSDSIQALSYRKPN